MLTPEDRLAPSCSSRCGMSQLETLLAVGSWFMRGWRDCGSEVERMVLFRIAANGWIGTHNIQYRSNTRNKVIE